MNYEDNALALAGNAINEWAAASRLTKVFTSSNAFFACAPKPYLQHYLQITRKNQQFYDGYVPWLHGKDIFSYKLVQALCGGFASKIVGKGVLFARADSTCGDDTIRKVSEWARENDLSTKCKQAIDYMLGFENSLIVLNFSPLEGFWPQVFREDYYVFCENAKGELTDVKMLSRSYAYNDGQGNVEEYMLIQHRYFKDKREMIVKEINGARYTFPVGKRIPYCVYEVCKMPSQINATRQSVNSYQPIPYSQLPDEVKSYFKGAYGAALIGEPIRMPFNESLGAWQLKNKGYNSISPNAPFGQALTQDIWVEAAEYDLYCTYRDIDINLGKGQIISKRSVSMLTLNVNTPANGGNVELGGINDPIGAEQSLFQNKSPVLESDDPEADKPLPNQFNLRGEEWNAIIDNLLRRIATKIHASPKIISSFLAESGSQKTATEIESDDDSVCSWIDEVRARCAPVFEDMLECLCNSMGWVGNVAIRFGKNGSKPESGIIKDIKEKLDLGIMTKKDAIKELYPEKDESEIERYMAECEADKKRSRDADRSYFLE